MHTHTDTLKILNCSKMTLSRYVKNGKLNKIKQGRKTFYDEHEVAALVSEIEDGKRKAGVKILPKEKIELPPTIENEIQTLSANTCLNKIGMEILSTTTADLINLGLYEECDRQILLCYALSSQAYNHYFVKSLEADVILNGQIIESEDETVKVFIGTAAVNQYHKMMMEHQKMMLSYSDRLGLNPLSRSKFEIEKPKKKSSIMDILNED